MSDLQGIARTITDLATPGMKPKDLVEAVRERHPQASKKEISRAAFYAMIVAAEAGTARAADVQGLALAARGGTDDLDDPGKAAPRTMSGRRSRGGTRPTA